ncbi:acyl-CoA carboxylase subunit beta [Haloglomus litoreum]|uniref:acyl-CoA carboxylase subunit beta n=1 Tax=Haloglomus litoreum TaxID=3034026 RepID=UPI0023E7DFBD|nr:acyl-CoA carboxylase subunit beta [Haloglomus sp. DT116]
MEVTGDFEGMSEEEQLAVATSLSNHFGTDIHLLDENSGRVVATRERVGLPRRRSMDGVEPATEREREVLADIEEILQGGPERGHRKIAEIGKRFVRDRIDQMFDELLFEDGTFAEYDSEENLAADAMITGAGLIDGRKLFFAANDFTVKAGTIASQSIEKLVRIQEHAIEAKAPILYLIDSAGGRIDTQADNYANRYIGGRQFYNQCLMSGRVPQIAVMYGPNFAGTAYQPVFADYLIMVRDISTMAIASPRMVEMVTGSEVSKEELGGPELHARHSGSVDIIAADEDDAYRTVHRLLGYLPQNYRDTPPRVTARPPSESPASTDTVIPDEPNAPYEIQDLIHHLVDDGSLLELKPEFAPEMVTALARIDGRSVGILANQPAVKSGAIYPASSEKAAGFVWQCDALNIPLLYLCDSPGYMVGKQVERDGVLQKGRKLVYATSCATVPKISVLLRKAYGAATYAMAGPAFGTDSVLALPSTEIAVMGPEAAVNAIYANKLAEIDDPEERARRERELREEYREDIDIRKLASSMVVDELVPPRDLRAELANRFEMYADKEKQHPGRKHGAMLF